MKKVIMRIVPTLLIATFLFVLTACGGTKINYQDVISSDYIAKANVSAVLARSISLGDGKAFVKKSSTFSNDGIVSYSYEINGTKKYGLYKIGKGIILYAKFSEINDFGNGVVLAKEEANEGFYLFNYNGTKLIDKETEDLFLNEISGDLLVFDNSVYKNQSGLITQIIGGEINGYYSKKFDEYKAFGDYIMAYDNSSEERVFFNKNGERLSSANLASTTLSAAGVMPSMIYHLGGDNCLIFKADMYDESEKNYTEYNEYFGKIRYSYSLFNIKTGRTKKVKLDGYVLSVANGVVSYYGNEKISAKYRDCAEFDVFVVKEKIRTSTQKKLIVDSNMKILNILDVSFLEKIDSNTYIFENYADTLCVRDEKNKTIFEATSCELKEKHVIIENNQRYGVADITGKMLVPVEYLSIDIYGNNALCKMSSQESYLISLTNGTKTKVEGQVSIYENIGAFALQSDMMLRNFEYKSLEVELSGSKIETLGGFNNNQYMIDTGNGTLIELI